MDFKSDEKAFVVYTALAVDKEVLVLHFFSRKIFQSLHCFSSSLQLQPDKVKRQMTVADGKLSVYVVLLRFGTYISRLYDTQS